MNTPCNAVICGPDSREETPISSSPAHPAAAIPARLDRLPWSRFHWLVVVALGITWILDGLEVTLAGSVAGALRESPVLQFSASDVGFANSAYLVGAVTGALFFGWLTDRWGRKRLFSITLGLYLLATAGTAFAWDLPSFVIMRFLTGAGIGGEYSAINSAIQELIPARRRGWTDLVINGSFWIGAALASGASILLLDPRIVDPEYGWRIAFFGGAAIGLVILWLRRFLPESPRWLATHGHAEEAERVIEGIEHRVEAQGHHIPDTPPVEAHVHARKSTPMAEVFRALFKTYPQRTFYCLVLMAAQAFFYNAIFFTYAMMLTDFYSVPSGRVGYYILPFAAGNVLGPLLLGRLFDSWGRRPMIILTYSASGILLAATGLAFEAGHLTPTTQTLCWSVTFFFASAAASAAYLTAAENFPLEMRALAIAIFYALGTLLGAVAPWVFSLLIESGSRGQVLLGYLFGAALMLVAALVTIFFGVAAERRPLEEVARPLSWKAPPLEPGR
ncbi:MFS family permease [Altererythrobacter atlanticus]|uniref:Inner membrane metabolite transport protein YdjE n=1 Tax=Croceibacterium atlanticum TaxID=1267766 RepID=A0A0F7KRB7_9SPHN|nr:MFS transporter [Croceibacterium atlanticum]AKH41752.1 Inner membrane metabolite transport protein YdjE [Croceibacterium atlanticum]MBB5733216.1 MFS family permease [Croceibacterium atlanticum]